MTGTPTGAERQDHLRILHEGLRPRATRIHFAGEHASLSHAWIQGAIGSGVRAASEIHDRALAAV